MWTIRLSFLSEQFLLLVPSYTLKKYFLQLSSNQYRACLSKHLSRCMFLLLPTECIKQCIHMWNIWPVPHGTLLDGGSCVTRPLHGHVLEDTLTFTSALGWTKKKCFIYIFFAFFLFKIWLRNVSFLSIILIIFLKKF